MPADPDHVRRTIAAYLTANGLAFVETNEVLSLRFASASVEIRLFKQGSQTLIALRAPVLARLELGAKDTAAGEVLVELNRLNCDSHFGKWALYEREDLIALEYDLLGDHLQEEELLTALAAVARLADAHDDRLQSKLGRGTKAFELH